VSYKVATMFKIISNAKKKTQHKYVQL